jgi:hypothetical protein
LLPLSLISKGDFVLILNSAYDLEAIETGNTKIKTTQKRSQPFWQKTLLFALKEE